MEKIPNIQATKEYQFAKEVENMLNNYSFNHSVFAASIPFMHPTIQQLLYRLIRKWRTDFSWENSAKQYEEMYTWLAGY